MAILWLAAFADVPASELARGAGFWESATACRLGDPHGDSGEFLPLTAPGEGAHVWIQCVDRAPGQAGWHLDLLVDDVPTEANRAESLGASVRSARPGLVTLASPAGQPFCIVAEDTERRCAAARQWPGGHRSLLDQISFDIPADAFDAEYAFWHQLTGWAKSSSSLPEFERLTRPDTLPLNLLFQRLEGGTISAHADFGCDDVAAERARHEALGASVQHMGKEWVTMRDPVGLTYCITNRLPYDQ